MRSLHPINDPLVSEWLSVGDGHEIYVEEAGNRDGIPAIFLHGGPGSGCKGSHRGFFDPDRYRIILFDQRGAGRSRPLGRVEHNTTPDLIADMERIRDRFGVERWLLFGGSWGAALALAYAETHPDKVLGMVLRGAFLARERDVAWFFGDGARRLLPGAWETFVGAVGADQSADLMTYLHASVFGGDPDAAERVARAWSQWSGEVVTFAIDEPEHEAPEPAETVLAKTRIELHYAKNRYFLHRDELLANAAKLPDVPVTIIHGQRDLTCTADSSWALHRAIPGSQIKILRTAGHLSGETPMVDALVDASDAMADRIERARAG